MTTKLEILYPRREARIHDAQSADAKVLSKRIAKIEASDMFKEHKRLVDLLSCAERAIPRFTCWHCSSEMALKDITLYDFVSISDGPDENRYDDFNIICPQCGRFSFMKGVKYIDDRFKDNVEVSS